MVEHASYWLLCTPMNVCVRVCEAVHVMGIGDSNLVLR